jgi:teichuronic acid exporter
MIETIASYCVRFVIGIILARILSPSDYGLIGMVTIFLSISDVFIDAGLGPAFIQKQDATEEDADTVFLLNFILGLIVYAAFWFLAPVIARFFKQQLLVNLIRVLFLVLIIGSLNTLQYAIIRKELQFKKRAILTVSASLVSGVVGIICALKGLGVWSLVIQQLLNKFVLCVLLYLFSSWKLKFKFSIRSAKQMFSFGGWVMCSNLINTIFNQYYRAFIGKMFSATDLGEYDRANQFQGMISESFTWAFGTVALPVFSKIQNDREAVKKKLNILIKYSSLIVYPLLCILYVVAKPLIVILITDKWINVVPILKAFCLVGLLNPIYMFMGPLFQSTGIVKIDFFRTITVCLLRIANTIINYRFGIIYIVLGDFVVLLLTMFLFSIIANKKLGFFFLESFLQLKWIILASSISLLVGLLLMDFLTNNIVRLLVISLAMLVAYFAIMCIFDKKVFSDLISVIKNSFK